MLKLNRSVAECLKGRPNDRLKAREVAEWIREAYPAEGQAKLDLSAAIHTSADLTQ